MNQSNENVSIYVFHYKDGEPFPELNGYHHIFCGKALHSGNSQLTGDDSGENISSKNPFYSELTGIYWAYKNQQSDIVGTCHYRRFYAVSREPLYYRAKRLLYHLAGIHTGRHGLIYSSRPDYWKDKILTARQARELLKHYDAIMPQKRKLRQSIEEHYVKYHNANDLTLLRAIIEEQSPSLTASFEEAMVHEQLYANNMMIMKRPLFDELCHWLFDILFEFERRINLAHYSEYQQRILGFLSERLITAWVHHKQLKVKELQLIYLKKLKKRHFLA